MTRDLRLVRELPGEADAFDQPAEVLGVGCVVELDQRLHVRVPAGKRQSASRERAFERDRESDRERRADRSYRLLAADARQVDVAEDDLLHVVELVRAGRRVAQDDLRERGLEVATARLRHEQQRALPGGR